MPYKDRDKQQAYQRDWVRRRRQQSLTSVEFVEPVSVEPSVEPDVTLTTTSVGIGCYTRESVTPTVLHPVELSPKPISDRGVLTLAAGGWLGSLTKEKQVRGFNR